MSAREPSSRGVERFKDRCWAKRWRDGSRPPKKRGAAPCLCLRAEEGEPGAEGTPTDERGRRGRLHPPLLEVHVWCRRLVCSRRAVGRGGPALHQGRAEALLSVGGGDVVRLDQPADARAVGSAPLSRDGADDGGGAWPSDGSLSSRGH